MRTHAIVLTGTILAAAGAAVAQPTTGVAEQLFRDGKALMEKGDYAKACIAFDGSYRKDPAVSTLLNLANCREKNHQYASAWGNFIDAERATRGKPDQANLNQTAHDRAAALEARLSHLIINVPDESRVDGLAITRNGDEVDTAEWNTSIAVDGGTYKIEGKAPGYEAWSTTVTVGAEQDTRSVNVPKFKAAPKPKTPLGSPAQPAVAHSSGKRKLAVGAWLVGGVALVAGGGLELWARSTYDDATHEPDDTKRDSLWHSANHERTAAAITATTGAVLVGAGLYLWLTGKPTERSLALAPSISPSTASLTLLGHF